MVYDGVSIGILRYSAYRADLYQRAYVIVRTEIFIDFNHDSFFFANLRRIKCFTKQILSIFVSKKNEHI